MMEVFVARQPIFNKNMEVYGYELFYRESFDKNYYPGLDGDKASSDVIASSYFLIGIKAMTNGKKCFINFTEKLLNNRIATLLPKDNLVIEVLETIEPDKILDACEEIKKAGYKIALDDFVFSQKYLSLMGITNYIKVDFKLTSAGERELLIKKYGTKNLKFIAEKVETKEEFDDAVRLGYSLFQGYFFSKPTTVAVKEVPPYKFNYLQLMKDVYHQEPDMKKISKAIENDVSLSYLLLRLVNSAALSHGNKISSILQALTLLGLDEIRKWTMLISLRKLGVDKPNELVEKSIIRAKFCELLAGEIGYSNHSEELFILGLISLIDVLVSRPMSEILEGLPINEDIKNALLFKIGPFAALYQLILAYEQGDWDRMDLIIYSLKLNDAKVIDFYYQALNWVNSLRV